MSVPLKPFKWYKKLATKKGRWEAAQEGREEATREDFAKRAKEIRDSQARPEPSGRLVCGQETEEQDGSDL